jgi:hypothetical protein
MRVETVEAHTADTKRKVIDRTHIRMAADVTSS